TEITINLPAQTITINSTGQSESFDINSYKKHCFINGYDDIDYLLSIKEKIILYEKNSNSCR
ncbi:MAG: 3-isopropylmalate dehydratase small subunit, partial [Prevotellaceae bacterium]|nr:3-isopropylmalate dehydratase small subunit [Prevotellaceae bacterium]